MIIAGLHLAQYAIKSLVFIAIILASLVSICNSFVSDPVRETQVVSEQLSPQPRAAAILTFAGKSYPKYLEWSCTSIQASSKYMDMLIFHENNDLIRNMSCGSNVFIIDLGDHGMSDLIARTIVQSEGAVSDENVNYLNLRNMLRYMLPKIPYFLAEFKPATGELFKNYLQKYTHWTYTDPDIIWGDVWLYVTENDLAEFDIYTISKTLDANRLFLRGQFSLHKNQEQINNIWRMCEHLYMDSLTRRLEQIIGEMQKATPIEAIKTAYFVSAEGAYSYWVFKNPVLKVKIQGLMYSDRHECPLRHYGGFLERCYSNGSCFSSQECATSLQEKDESKIVPLPEPYQVEVKPTMGDCLMTWVSKEYQYCIRCHLGRLNEATFIHGTWYANDNSESERLRSYGLAAFHFRLWEDVDTIYSFIGKKEQGNDCFMIYRDNKYMRIHHCNDHVTPNLELNPYEELEQKTKVLASRLRVQKKKSRTN